MTTGFALTFAFLAVVFMVVGAGFGALTTVMTPANTPRETGFDWGMAFGPFGVVVLAVIRTRSRHRETAGQAPFDRPRDRSRWSPHRAADVLIVLGAMIIVASAFLPWLHARSRTESFSYAPATEPVLAIGSWIVLVFVVGGASAFVVRRSAGVIACASAIWFNVSLVYWLLGSTVATWLPTEVLPDNLTASVQAGASVGLAGSSLVLVGAAVACSEQTWRFRAPRIESWTFLGGITVALVALAGRNMPWIDIAADDFRWILAVDAVPGVGDVISLVLLFIAGSALVTAVTRWLIPAVATIVAGIVTVGIALIGLGSGAVVERAGAEIAKQVVSRDVDVDTDIDALLIAPAWFALTGILAIAIGITSLRRSASVARSAAVLSDSVPGFRDQNH